jgi:hypothetical protein
MEEVNAGEANCKSQSSRVVSPPPREKMKEMVTNNAN